MSRLLNKKGPNPKKAFDYKQFDKINGDHPLKHQVHGVCVEYQVRTRRGGKIAYFNFSLAKEMGLISKDHPETLNRKLEEKLLETFSIVIINEYDYQNNVMVHPKDVKEHRYMATRYLQIQHPNKQGLTSGDGRSVWNGEVNYRGKSWDISSCGTGATCLSPATSIHNRFFQTGDPSISYGCGYSEKDEGLTTLFFSEVLKRQGYETEEVLAIIEYSGGIAVNVRAHKNLLRPSHFFTHLKQGQYERLLGVYNYYMEKQSRGGEWKDIPVGVNKRYDYFLDKISRTFAETTAHFEDDYIFCWIDWDGDNILMDGGIIDYGSIRQFGLFHNEYRFDDVERFSTTISEQKHKAKYIVQCFAQAIDFLKTKEKKNINEFSEHWAVKRFDKYFEMRKDFNILYKVGFSDKQIEFLLDKHLKLVQSFRDVFSYFERAKSKRGRYEVPDGINWDAIFCMRDILREVPQLYHLRDDKISHQEFIDIIKSSYAKEDDLTLTPYRKTKIDRFQRFYLQLVGCVAKEKHVDRSDILLEITMRSSVINRYDKITGDAIGNIVEKVMKHRPKLKPEEIQKVLNEFLSYQISDPSLHPDKGMKGEKRIPSRLVKKMLEIVTDFREGL